jgi:hypothetical protein
MKQHGAIPSSRETQGDALLRLTRVVVAAPRVDNLNRRCAFKLLVVRHITPSMTTEE